MEYSDPLHLDRHYENSSDIPFGGTSCHLPQGQSHHFRFRQQEETLLQEMQLRLTEMQLELTYTKRQFIERWLKNSHRIQWQRQSWLGEAGYEILIRKCFLIHPSLSSLAVCFIHFSVCVYPHLLSLSQPPRQKITSSGRFQVYRLHPATQRNAFSLTLLGSIPISKALGKKLLGGFTWVCHWPHQLQQGAGSPVRNTGALCSHTSVKGKVNP